MRILKFFATIAFAGVSSFSWAQPLPSQVLLGAATIHRYQEPAVIPSSIVITTWVPIPSPEQPGTLVNVNQAQFPKDLPAQFIIGDGSTHRAFIGVDLSPGSKLSLKLNEIENDLKLKNLFRGETLLNNLRVRINQLIRWTEGSHLNNGLPEFPWDKAIQVPVEIDSAFSQAGSLPVFHFPVSAGIQYPVVPFEKYLDAGQGYCLQKALLASLLLSRAGISHRLVNGAVSISPGNSVGHTWIELADGRVLDVAWEILTFPQKGHPSHSDWIQIGGSWRFENQNYLIFVPQTLP